MYEIPLLDTTHISVDIINHLTTPVPFTHVDRLATFHVLIYVLQGTIYVSEEDQDYAVSAGELLLLKEGQHQIGRRETAANTSWIYAHFRTFTPCDAVSGKQPSQTQSPDSGKQPSPAQSPDSAMPDMLLLPKYTQHLTGSALEAQLFELLSLYQSNDPLRHYHLPHQFAAFLLTLYAHETVQPSGSASLHLQIKSYLQAHVTDTLTAADLEKNFHLSYKYLSRVFKHHEKTSIMHFQLMLRIKKATRLLLASADSISAIAEKCGFTDSLYFSRCFKKEIGLSPKQYRQKQLAAY